MPDRNAHARQNATLRMFEAGASWAEIANATGYRSRGAMHAAVRSALRRQGRPVDRLEEGGRIIAGTRATEVEAAATHAVDRAVGRRFGVEIETEGLTPAQAVEALTAAGITAVAENYNHRTRRHWKVVTDGSLMYGGAEVVSPILTGEDGLTEMRKVMKALRHAGARVSNRCGLHVHHDMNDATNETKARFVEVWNEQQGTIDRMVHRSRRGNFMCRPLSASEVRTQASACRRNGRPTAGDRYRALNLQSYAKYGTFEVRQHQGTLNGTKATAWVRMVWAMLDAIEADATLALPSGAAMLGALVDHGRLNNRSAAYLTARMEALT